MKSLDMAYLFWLPSLFGVAGLHRIYMGKIGTGLLFLFTGGLAGIGTIYDAITMSTQVAEVNHKEQYLRGFSGDAQQVLNRIFYTQSGTGPSTGSMGGQPRPKPSSVEQVIFRLAQKNGGSVSPAQLALDANIGADEAKVQLESMVDRGYAELRVRKTGALSYVFPEFLQPDVASQFETLT